MGEKIKGTWKSGAPNQGGGDGEVSSRATNQHKKGKDFAGNSQRE